jgi:hypothetical protein
VASLHAAAPAFATLVTIVGGICRLAPIGGTRIAPSFSSASASDANQDVPFRRGRLVYAQRAR